jgi:antitoxin (DNA-binding transcriptional repressor) of toxin-antitoxin stability system
MRRTVGLREPRADLAGTLRRVSEEGEVVAVVTGR